MSWGAVKYRKCKKCKKVWFPSKTNKKTCPHCGAEAKEKYGRQRIEATPGHWFDSKLEAAVFSLLALRQRGGEIRDLAHHGFTVYLSEAKIGFRPDFRFVECASGETAYAEAKGFPTAEWQIKKRLWEWYGPGRLFVYGGSYTSVKILEEIIPKVDNA